MHVFLAYFSNDPFNFHRFGQFSTVSNNVTNQNVSRLFCNGEIATKLAWKNNNKGFKIKPNYSFNNVNLINCIAIPRWLNVYSYVGVSSFQLYGKSQHKITIKRYVVVFHFDYYKLRFISSVFIYQKINLENAIIYNLVISSSQIFIDDLAD